MTSVILNDILCLAYNQHDLIPMAELCKICSDHLDNKEILTAKKLIYEYADPAERCVSNRNSEKDVEDIVKLLNSDKLDESCLSVFAVSDLSRIPSVLPFHMDSSQMMSTMRHLQAALLEAKAESSSLRDELSAIKASLGEVTSMKAQLQETRAEITKL